MRRCRGSFRYFTLLALAPKAARSEGGRSSVKNGLGRRVAVDGDGDEIDVLVRASFARVRSPFEGEK